jgi:iron complex transport system substrate-binding protein
MKPTPIKRILIVLAVLLALVLAMATLAQAAPITAGGRPNRPNRHAGPAAAAHRQPAALADRNRLRARCLRAPGGCGPLFQLAGQRGAVARVGGGLDPNIEAIVALRPDVVLMATSSRAQARLESLGLKVVALEPKTYADVQRVLGKVGQVLGVQDAQRSGA